MVICCVPKCGTDSWKCDPSITFHDFPSNPDLAAKWIKQINSAIRLRPMWFPRGRPVICSKHFLHTDFKGDSDALKPRCVPTVFGHKYIGQNPEPYSFTNNAPKKSPLIVKVIKPQETITDCETELQISNIRTEENFGNAESKQNNDTTGYIENKAKVLHVSTNKYFHENKLITNDSLPDQSDVLYIGENSVRNNSENLNSVCKSNTAIQQNSLPKKKFKRKEKLNNDLIEIGPNTFLKINPDIIKVNKKMTPSGNTVLQFLMDQNLAKSHGGDILPKVVQGIPRKTDDKNNSDAADLMNICDNSNNDNISSNVEKERVVQHVLGHLVDTHICKEACKDLKLTEDENVSIQDSQENLELDHNLSEDKTNSDKSKVFTSSSNINNERDGTNNTDSSFIEKAPVLFKTNMPLSHCFIDKPKYLLQLKQKSRQIAALKFKVSSLTKKIEELEDRCIVQERQLSYSFIKRLKTIRKNAAKGDPSATYILEQIRSYSNNSKMRWSDSTLTQCAIWCKKAPYAYEYFKKAEFFKLPCLGTVKRYIKKHPEENFKKRSTKCGPQDENDDESSSDFDFDESDGQNDANGLSDEGNDEPVTCKAVLSAQTDVTNPNIMQTNDSKDSDERCNRENIKLVDGNSEQSSDIHRGLSSHEDVNNETDKVKNAEDQECVSSNGIPVTVDGSNLEVQEIILPSGDVVQCYSSSISNGTDIGSQYFIIPNVGDQNCNVDHEYSVVQTDSLPVILQNFDNSQLHLQQDQLIFITNSSDQVECSETEVTSA